MDKFGIFKLLSSFFGQNSEQQTKNVNKNDKSDGVNDFVSSLFNAVTNNDTARQPQKSDVLEKKEKQFMPLQSSMLSTMNSHDQFIKRVKEKNK